MNNEKHTEYGVLVHVYNLLIMKSQAHCALAHKYKGRGHLYDANKTSPTLKCVACDHKEMAGKWKILNCTVYPSQLLI